MSVCESYSLQGIVSLVIYSFYLDSHSVKAAVEIGNSMFFLQFREQTVGGSDHSDDTENASVSQTTYIPGNFENIFCPSPTQGKILAGKLKVEARQHCLK